MGCTRIELCCRYGPESHSLGFPRRPIAAQCCCPPPSAVFLSLCSQSDYGDGSLHGNIYRTTGKKLLNVACYRRIISWVMQSFLIFSDVFHYFLFGDVFTGYMDKMPHRCSPRHGRGCQFCSVIYRAAGHLKLIIKLTDKIIFCSNNVE